MKERKSLRQERLDASLPKYETMFRAELPQRMPPVSEALHTVDTESAPNLSSSPPCHLFRAEVLAVKEYVENLLQNEKTRRSRSRFGLQYFL